MRLARSRFLWTCTAAAALLGFGYWGGFGAGWYAAIQHYNQMVNDLLDENRRLRIKEEALFPLDATAAASARWRSAVPRRDSERG